MSASNEALAVRWLSKVKQARSHWAADFREIKGLRRLAAGECEEGADDDLGAHEYKKKRLRVNLIHSTIAGLLPHVYARLPEVAVEPKESVRQEDYPALQAFARVLEIVLGDQLTQAKLKRVAKTAVRRCFSGRVAWAKVGWQQDIRHDPVIVQRIADTQDDIVRLEALIREVGESQVADVEASREEMRLLVESLESTKEVVISSGLTIDLVRPEHILIETHIDDWEEWDKTEWIGHEIPMTLTRARELFPDAVFSGGCAAGADVLRPIAAPGEGNKTRSGSTETMVSVVEIWDRRTMTVYTVSDHAAGFVREPFQPDIVPDRWFPFVPLALNVTDGRFWPLSLTEMLAVLQDEYLETREKFAEHRSKAVPSLIFDADALSPATIRRLADKEVLENIPVNANGRPLDALVAFTKYPPIDGGLYDTGSIRFDIEMASGLQDAARGAIARAKTATEADIMQSALGSRVSEMQDGIEDWIEVVAEMAAQMALLAMSPEEVATIAGSAESWPVLDREGVYRKVRVKIRAGTSGKPDKAAQQKAWSQILPLAMDLMGRVAQAEATQNMALATGFRELLAETLRRLDERFDVDRLLPHSAAPQQAMPAAPDQAGLNGLQAQVPEMING